jgi:glycosyltransferase involved in cell wall biosynthesis
VGGSQSRFVQFVRGVPERYRHTVLVQDGKLDMAQFLPAGSAVEVIPTLLRRGFGGWAGRRAMLRQLRPDLLITYNWGAMDWCLANYVAPITRHVHIEDGFGPEERNRQLRRRVWTRRFALSGRNNLVVVPSQSLERLARNIWRLPAANLRYIPNGVDCARFAGERREWLPGQPLVVGTVATLRPEKNLQRLLRLFCVLAAEEGGDRLELIIVGDGPERAKLEAMARASACADRIRFTGATATPERELCKFDIFALTSDTEQMPLSVLEATASALPIISFAVGDLRNMVAPKNEAFVSIPLSDDAGFLEKLRLLAGSAALRTRLGTANRAWTRERYDQGLMLDRYVALFG